MQSFRRVALVVSGGWLIFLLGPLSGTGLGFGSFLPLFAITIVLGAVSLTFVLLGSRPRRWAMVVWLAYPVAVAALLVLFIFSQSTFNPLFRLRFYASRGELESVARLAVATGSPIAPRRVGLFRVQRVDVVGSMVWLVSGGCGVVDECGLLYAPGAAPGPRAKMRLQHIEGPWYHLYAVF